VPGSVARKSARRQASRPPFGGTEVLANGMLAGWLTSTSRSHRGADWGVVAVYGSSGTF